MSLENDIRARASALGFSLCGFTQLTPLPREQFFRNWLAQGYAGDMQYLAREPYRRLHPEYIFPQATSVICLGYPYTPPRVSAVDWQRTLRGRIAAYAAGPDYHHVIQEKLSTLVVAIQRLRPHVWARPYVDTGPIFEREWAYRSSLGWFGKNTMLLHKQTGSSFFLAEIFVNLELVGEGIPREHCGTCTRCLNDCPTDALAAGYVLQAPLCISYLTIEHRGAIPRELRPRMGNWIFGCDICQEVCPWNEKFGRVRDDLVAELFPSLPELMTLDDAGFRHRFRGTAIKRAKRRGLLRNVAVALGNSGNPDAVSPLSAALRDPEPLVREHAAWALGRLPGPAARATLQRHLAVEAHRQVRMEILTALDTAT